MLVLVSNRTYKINHLVSQLNSVNFDDTVIENEYFVEVTPMRYKSNVFIETHYTPLGIYCIRMRHYFIKSLY